MHPHKFSNNIAALRYLILSNFMLSVHELKKHIAERNIGSPSHFRVRMFMFKFNQ